MNAARLSRAFAEASGAARAAGELMRRHWRAPKTITQETQHDIKLELDQRCQSLIERRLRKFSKEIAVLGEERTVGDPVAECRWVVDPIDGTVNFNYQIPHACVSIALQQAGAPGASRRLPAGETHETLLGVVFDPFAKELFAAGAGLGGATVNGRAIRVSQRARLDQAVVSIGFSKQPKSMREMLPLFLRLLARVRKVRLMGSAALSMVYVAAGRFDAYLESGVRLWDIAAGGLILEKAGGDFSRELLSPDYRYRLCANNGRLRRPLVRQIRNCRGPAARRKAA